MAGPGRLPSFRVSALQPLIPVLVSVMQGETWRESFVKSRFPDTKAHEQWTNPPTSVCP